MDRQMDQSQNPLQQTQQPIPESPQPTIVSSQVDAQSTQPQFANQSVQENPTHTNVVMPDNLASSPQPQISQQMVNKPSESQASKVLFAYVDYYTSAVGVPKKGSIDYDGNIITLKSNSGDIIFQTPITGIQKVSRSTVYLYITVNGHKYSVVFGGAVNNMAKGVLIGGVASELLRHDTEQTSGMEDWVTLFTQAGVMTANLSTSKLAKMVFIIVGIPLGLLILFVIIAAAMSGGS